MSMLVDPGDGTELNSVDGGPFGWIGSTVQWIIKFVRPSDDQSILTSSDTSSVPVSDLTADIRLLAVIATGVMILAALALLLTLIAIVRSQRSQQSPFSHEPWLRDGVQVYPTGGPVTFVGYTPEEGQDDQQSGAIP